MRDVSALLGSSLSRYLRKWELAPSLPRLLRHLRAHPSVFLDKRHKGTELRLEKKEDRMIAKGKPKVFIP